MTKLISNYCENCESVMINEVNEEILSEYLKEAYEEIHSCSISSSDFVFVIGNLSKSAANEVSSFFEKKGFVSEIDNEVSRNGNYCKSNDHKLVRITKESEE